MEFETQTQILIFIGIWAVGWVEKSKLLKNILGHVDPVVIHKIRDFP